MRRFLYRLLVKRHWWKGRKKIHAVRNKRQLNNLRRNLRGLEGTINSRSFTALAPGRVEAGKPISVMKDGVYRVTYPFCIHPAKVPTSYPNA